jgi:glycosyltransferase involved in cell wall biosynthesis
LCQFEGIEALSVPYIRPPGNWYNRWSGLVVFRGIKGLVRELHRAKGFDIIYATDFFPDGDAAVRLSRCLGVPAACLCIGVDVNITAHSSKVIYSHFVGTARALQGTLACGRSVADGIDAVTSKRALCVYGVIDLEEFSPADDKESIRRELGLPAKKVIALYAGYLQERKGIYEMLEAFSRIASIDDNILLCVCGSGEEEERFGELVRRRNLTETIKVVGEVPPERMSRWVKASDLFVLATHTEGMPNVVMEAMACGLPVVATQVGGLPEAVADCEGAILVPARDVEKFKDAVLRVAQDEGLRRRMGAAARARAEERFEVMQNARRILEHLSGIVEANRRANGRC